MKLHLLKTFRILGIVALLFGLGACTDDLNREPFPVSGLTSASVYKDPANYRSILAKLYAGLATTGQQGPDGKGDVAGIDEGFSQYLRQYWQAQELTTDEAVIAWNDADIWDLHDMDWSAGHSFLRALYYRLFYQISLANEFIRETTDAKLSERGISGTDAANIKVFRAEARFLRALSYYHALDLYGNVPFVTDENPIGSYVPTQTNRADLYNYIESELLAIDADLPAPRANEYGRADKAAAWMVLAKLYLNAEVYNGQKKYTECIAQCNKIIAAGYTLEPNYRHLFLADNHKSKEIIFPITFDGTRTKTWGGMTYLVHAPVGGSMNPNEFGINGGWYGLRTTSALVSNFNDITGATDKRAMFYTDGQKLAISDISAFNDGYAISKYRNVTSTNEKGSDVEGNFPDTDFPMFRLADAYLMYAEAVKRGGTGGSEATAIQYINNLRVRAYGGATGNVTSYDLDFVLAERARELYWEAHRRTDLIRYGKFTGASYLWPWKGGVKDGKSVEDFRSLFPIPDSDVVANPNLKQNTGY
ncbi:MAG: RagB/SusD family nutrient uptake outer membrane protein [Haliscomenobacter sp.]|nr:RagB/SusD family nutrient uptake outer membrane protein [Haliscomenobacter sp.]